MYNSSDIRSGYVGKQASVKDTALIDDLSVLIKVSFAWTWIQCGLIFRNSFL
jgi:hypothetical protein